MQGGFCYNRRMDEKMRTVLEKLIEKSMQLDWKAYRQIHETLFATFVEDEEREVLFKLYEEAWHRL